ncbi:hypothetical protein [Neobacillus muris]|uniref:hypothetical protein n=1 Tax=Neobacillus muris TaxID=2941334 RepID=UPI002040EBE7|nr:hypothetical protein [Neobacillus muris]
MKGKIKVSRLYIFLFVNGLASFFGFYNYINSSVYNVDQQAIFIILISIVLFLFSRIKIYKDGFLLANILFIAMILVSIVVARLRYDQPWYYTIKESIYYVAAILATFAMKHYCKNKDAIEYLKKAIVIVAIICSVISIVEYVSLLGGVDILRLDTYIKYRYDTPRFEIGSLALILGFFIAISKLLARDISTKEKRLYISYLILLCINLYFIIKTRSLMLYLIVALIIGILFNKKTSIKIKILLYALLGFCVIGLFLSNIMVSINTLFQEDMGIAVRFKALDYYWDKFLEYPLTGLGFLSGSETLSTSSILLGGNGNFYQSDVGIIGFVSKFGAIGLIWMCILYRAMISKLILFRNKIDDEHYLLLFMLIVYLAITSVNLIFTDTNKILYMPVVMIFFSASKYYQKE